MLEMFAIVQLIFLKNVIFVISTLSSIELSQFFKKRREKIFSLPKGTRLVR